MLALNRKLLRDIGYLKTQLLAIGLVIGCGVAMIVLAWSMLAALQLTQETYYEQYHFAHVFARLKRAPAALARRIAGLPGVVVVQTRVVEDVTLDYAGMPEPAIGRLISLSDPPSAGLNRLHLRAGHFPARQSADEVLVSEGFASAHGLRPGDHLFAILNGRRQRLVMTGIALSPEYVYQLREGEMIPNDRTFGVFWMNHDALAAAFNMEGAFNDVTLWLQPGVSESRVVEQLDSLLEEYGGLGAVGRELQTSNRYVTNELRELRNMGYFAPVIFLLVAAFLLNIVLSRIIGTQREQIATLKAFGYTRREIGWHYLKMTSAVVVLGVIIGTLAGDYLGRGMAEMYSNYFRFPVLRFEVQVAVIGWAAVISLLASLAGVVQAVGRAVRLPPAAAMQPEPPAVYQGMFAGRLSLRRRRRGTEYPLPRTPYPVPRTEYPSPVRRMIVRHLASRPLTTLLTVVGLALAVAVMVLGNHGADAIDSMLDFVFFEMQHYNVSVGFVEPAESRSIGELARLPGVLQVEPTRAVAARLRAGHRSRLQGITGLPADPQLYRLVDSDGRRHRLPPEGLLMSRKLAELLDVRVGDRIEVAVLEGRRPVAQVLVTGLIDDMLGTSVYMELGAIQRLLSERSTVSGALLLVESGWLPEVYRRLKATPRVAGVSARLAILQSFRDTLVRTVLRMRAINLLFASIIACGVVYNSARITVAERARELATLRVMGYTRAEISWVLLGELGALTMLAIPLGLVAGYGLVVFVTWGYDTELFRLPVVIYPRTYGMAAVSVLFASLISAFIVRRRLDRLDLVSVLKARD